MSLGKLVTAWFTARRGAALGIMFAAASLGPVLHPLWANAVMTQSGWRTVYWAMAVLTLFLAIPCALGLLRERQTANTSQASSTAGAGTASPTTGTNIAQVLRDAAFWWICAYMALFALSMASEQTHLFPLLTERGATPGQAAIATEPAGRRSAAGQPGRRNVDRPFQCGPRRQRLAGAAHQCGFHLVARAGIVAGSVTAHAGLLVAPKTRQSRISKFKTSSPRWLGPPMRRPSLPGCRGGPPWPPAPKCSPQVFAIEPDSVIGVNPNHTRVRYRTNTLRGSSGSPVLSAQWDLVALHNFGRRSQYNQGIPTVAIAARPAVAAVLA